MAQRLAERRQLRNGAQGFCYRDRAVSDRNLTFDFDAGAAEAATPTSTSTSTPTSTEEPWPPAYPVAEVPKPVREEPGVLTVGELGRIVRGALDRSFAVPVFVEGEVVGARFASSGHVYFTLKDEAEDANLDVVLYRTSLTPRAKKAIVDGARVRLRGKPTFWAPRGRLQFVADRAEPAGRGALLEAIERLKEKLTAEGLFAPERKRKLPEDPRIIGVVTSAGGAVIHDICKVAARRGGARILLAPALVQGVGAAASVLRALEALQRVAEVDVIIVGRGGGAFDELLAFSDEALVRAIAACRVPVVSAVGHEVDVTLADFAADRRAATPSQAAEMLVPDRAAKKREALQLRGRLHRAVQGRLARERAELLRCVKELSDPRLLLAVHQQTKDDKDARLAAFAQRLVARRREGLATVRQRLAALHPGTVLAKEGAEVRRLEERMRVLVRTSLTRQASDLSRFGARLDAMSPLKVLGRGYAIATDEAGRAVRSAASLKTGDRVQVRVDQGRFSAAVLDVHEDDE